MLLRPLRLRLSARLHQRFAFLQQAGHAFHAAAGLLAGAFGDGLCGVLQGLAHGLLVGQGLFAHALPVGLQLGRHGLQRRGPCGLLGGGGFALRGLGLLGVVLHAGEQRAGAFFKAAGETVE